MPDAAADSGLSAFDTSIHAQTLSARVSCARNDKARAVLPEHSAPIISVTAPTGSPPSRTASTAATPVGTTSRIVFAAGVSADGILSARAASICERRAAAVRIGFALFSPIPPRRTTCACKGNGAIASRIQPQVIDRKQVIFFSTNLAIRPPRLRNCLVCRRCRQIDGIPWNLSTSPSQFRPIPAIMSRP